MATCFEAQAGPKHMCIFVWQLWLLAQVLDCFVLQRTDPWDTIKEHLVAKRKTVTPTRAPFGQELKERYTEKNWTGKLRRRNRRKLILIQKPGHPVQARRTLKMMLTNRDPNSNPEEGQQSTELSLRTPSAAGTSLEPWNGGQLTRVMSPTLNDSS